MRDLETMRRAGTSILSKMRDTARATATDPEFLQRKFVVERFMARLGEGAYRDIYVLKGGMRMLCANSEMARSTEDLDLTSSSPFTKEQLLSHLRDIADTVPAQEDGIEYAIDEKKAVDAMMRREDSGNPGIRVILDVRLHHSGGTFVSRVKVDAAYGEAINPAPAFTPMSPTLRGWEPPTVLSYPWETVLAEKVHAIVRQGFDNTRMRDFYDILAVTRAISLPGDTLSQAVHATFETRRSASMDARPVGLTPEFAERKKTEWAAFNKKAGARLKLADFRAVVDEVAAFATPLLQSTGADTLGRNWVAGQGWVA